MDTTNVNCCWAICWNSLYHSMCVCVVSHSFHWKQQHKARTPSKFNHFYRVCSSRGKPLTTTNKLYIPSIGWLFIVSVSRLGYLTDNIWTTDSRIVEQKHDTNSLNSTNYHCESEWVMSNVTSEIWPANLPHSNPVIRPHNSLQPNIDSWFTITDDDDDDDDEWNSCKLYAKFTAMQIMRVKVEKENKRKCSWNVSMVARCPSIKMNLFFYTNRTEPLNSHYTIA